MVYGYLHPVIGVDVPTTLSHRCWDTDRGKRETGIQARSDHQQYLRKSLPDIPLTELNQLRTQRNEQEEKETR